MKTTEGLFLPIVFLCFLACATVIVQPGAHAQEWATTCTLESGPGNEGNADPMEATGIPDCVETDCPMNDCRVQLGNLGVLECENLDVPGGWIVPTLGDKNDITVYEGATATASEWATDSYDVYVENPDVPDDWILAGSSTGGPERFDLPEDPYVPYTNRIQIRDRGETIPSPIHWGADIDAIGSGSPLIEYCDPGWGPAKAEASVLGGSHRSIAGSKGSNLFVMLCVSLGAVVLGRALRRRKKAG